MDPRAALWLTRRSRQCRHAARDTRTPDGIDRQQQHESSARPAEGADKLVDAVLQRLADGFASERSGLEKQWDSGDNLSS
jgi:hypothetical protein